MQPLRVAVVGMGYMGKKWANAIRRSDYCELAYTCDPFVREPSGVPHLQNYRLLRGRHKPDAAIIATPATTHFEVASSLLENRIHCLVEKPLATSTKDCQSLVAKAYDSGSTLMTGHIVLYHPHVQLLKYLLTHHHGQIGNLSSFEAVRSNPGPVRDDVNVLWDFAPHDISVGNYLVGSLPTVVSGHAAGIQNQERFGGVELDYADGVHGYVSVTNAATEISTRRLTIYTDLKSVIVADEVGKTIDIHFGRDRIQLKLPSYNPLDLQLDHFIKSIQNETRPKSDGEDGYQTVRILEEAIKGNRQKVPLKW